MLMPGVDFTTIGKVDGRVLQVRQRQRRHQRPPDQLHALQRAAQSGAAAGPREEAHRERQGRRDRRQHELHGVRNNWKYYKSKGFIVIGAGVQAESSARPSSSSRTWGRATATSALPRPSFAPARSRSSSPRRTRSRPMPTVVWSRSHRRRASLRKCSRPRSRSRTRTRPSLKLVQAAGPGGGVILDFTPDSAPALLKAGYRTRSRRQGEVGLIDTDRRRLHGEELPRVRREDVHQLEFGLNEASRGRTPGSCWRS